MSKNNQQNGKQVQPAAQPTAPVSKEWHAHCLSCCNEEPYNGTHEFAMCTKGVPKEVRTGPLPCKQYCKRETPIISTQETVSPTTIKLKGLTKSRLDALKGIMKIDDYDGVVNRLIDNLPAKLSTETEVHLVMTKSKYTWLMAKQDTCDCRTCLNDSRV
jgi:hypothetical protein